MGLEPLLGEMDVVRLTVPAKPPMLVNVIVLLVAEPRVTFTGDGVAEIEKSGEGGRTTLRILVTLWLSLPLVPSIVIVYVFSGADAGTDTVRVEDPAPVRRDTELGFNAIVTLLIPGEIEYFRLTLPAKLFKLASVTVKAARLPSGVVIETGLVPSVKSGAVDCPIPATSLSIVEA